MNTISEWLTALVFFSGSVVANAQLVAVNGGALVNDTSDNLTWLRDGNFFATQATGSGNPAAFVKAIITVSGGVIDDTRNGRDTPPNSGRHTLTMNDFYHNGSIDGHLTWFGARAWVNYLNVTDYQGYNNWRLPTSVDNNSSVGYPSGGARNPPVSSSELAELFYRQLGQMPGQAIQTKHNSRYSLFRNIGASYWSGTEVAGASFHSAWSFVDSEGRQLESDKDSYNEALAVRFGQAYQCESTYNGTFRGNVTVTSGLICIVNARVSGNVQQSGGQLRIVGSEVIGNVQVSGNGEFTIGPGAIISGDLQIQNLPGGSVQNEICDTTVRGNLQFQNNGTAVEIGSDLPSCAGNSVGGNLEVQNNTGSTAISNDIVVGNLQDHNNTAATQVFDNFVEQNLQCQNNVAISGGGNSAKQKQDQCSSL
jgi:cytoskeletal protein CcmA (bactofilin family)